MSPTLRPDLEAAHSAARASLVSAGTWWSARERRSLALTAELAMWADEPLAPWATDSDVLAWLGGREIHAPVAAHRAAARMARHSATITRDWYDRTRDEVGELRYVELVGIVCLVAATTSLQRCLGLPSTELPVAPDDDATGQAPPTLSPARLNWVPVAAPADTTAAVVQALTAVPRSNVDLWRLADAQYIPDAEMVDPRWTRGTLTRPEMELVAVSVSSGRECHY